MTVTPEAPRASNTVDELYRRHSAEVYRYAYGVLGNRPDAEDMTQSTFVNALRALERGEQPRKPGNWLIAIAHNVARERFRRTQARPTEVAFDVDAIGASPTDDDETPSLAELMHALGRIPTQQRSALVLREFEGRPYAEIARILGVSTGALETLLFRARRSLADELENVVTCERAAHDIARLRDGTIGRKDRRRLEDHLRECPACASLHKPFGRPKRVLGGLLVWPLWSPLNLFRSGHKAITTTALHGSETAAGASGAGLAVGGGLAAKVTAVVVTTAVAGSIGYAGVTHVRAQSVAHTSGGTAPTGKATARDALEPATAGRTAANLGPANRSPQTTASIGGAAAPGRAARGQVASTARGGGKASGAARHAAGARGGKSASAPGQTAAKPGQAGKPLNADKTQSLPTQAQKPAAPTQAAAGSSPGKSKDAPGTTTQADPAQGKSADGSTDGNGKQSPAK